MSMSREEIMQDEADASCAERKKVAAYGRPGEVPDDYPVSGPIADDDLLPCPFCGEVPTIDYASLSEVWSVRCENDKCDVGCETAASEQEAVINSWNRRNGASALTGNRGGPDSA